MGPRAFRRWLLAAALLGLAVRVAYIVLERRHEPVGGDAFFYHVGANLLAEGHGFVEPLPFVSGISEQSASHPPLYLAWLAIPSLAGLDTPVWHMLWSALLGTGTVVLLGLVGREIAGPRAGVISAVLAALYVNLWLWDGFLVSETSSAFCAALVLLLAYRYHHRPMLRGAAWLGAACGLAALARAELSLLVVLVALPLVLLTRAVDLRERLKWFVVSAMAALLVVTPWVTYNLTRFNEPVLLSTGLEPTLLGAYCDATFYGRSIGYFSPDCVVVPAYDVDPGDDQSERNAVSREVVFDYLGDHLTRLPVVVAARWGRVAGLYRPRQQVELDTLIEGRERWVAETAWVSWYLMAGLAIAGAGVLRRRRDVPVFPLLALPAVVLVAVGMTLASNRYRASAEGAVVVLAGVAVDALLRRREGAPPDRTPGAARAAERVTA